MLTNKIKKYLDDRHIYNITTRTNIDGIDNISCCVNDKYIIIEVQNKDSWGGVVQSFTQQEIRQNGGIVFSTTTLTTAKLRILSIIHNTPFNRIITDDEFKQLDWYEAFKTNSINCIKQDIDSPEHEADDIFSTRLSKFRVAVILKEAFLWEKTVEGYNFWNNIHTKHEYTFKVKKEK